MDVLRYGLVPANPVVVGLVLAALALLTAVHLIRRLRRR
jgi:hypothetical protein